MRPIICQLIHRIHSYFRARNLAKKDLKDVLRKLDLMESKTAEQAIKFLLTSNFKKRSFNEKNLNKLKSKYNITDALFKTEFVIENGKKTVILTRSVKNNLNNPETVQIQMIGRANALTKKHLYVEIEPIKPPLSAPAPSPEPIPHPIELTAPIPSPVQIAQTLPTDLRDDVISETPVIPMNPACIIDEANSMKSEDFLPKGYLEKWFHSLIPSQLTQEQIKLLAEIFSIDDPLAQKNILRVATPFFIELAKTRKIKHQFTLSLYQSNVNQIKEKCAEICAIWAKAGLVHLTPIHFDEEKEKIYFDLTLSQISALGAAYPAFEQFVGCLGRNIFSGYIMGGYECTYEWPLLFDFAKEASEGIKASVLHNIQVDVPQNKEQTAADTLLQWLANKDYEGVVIGEAHVDGTPKALLIQTMEKLKASGVTTIFLEFLTEDDQKAIDRYLNSQEADVQLAPEVLAKLITEETRLGSEAKNGSGLIDVIRTAKQHGIRIVGVESEASSWLEPLRSVKNRMTGMNYSAKQIIEKEKGEGKYVVLVGNAHASTHENVPGLSELIGVPNLLILKKFTWSTAPVKTGFNISSPVEGLTGMYHAVFEVE